MAEITAQQMQDKQRELVQELIDAAQAVHDIVESLRVAQLEQMQVFFGGLPREIETIGAQSAFWVSDLANRYSLPQPEA